MQVEKGSTNVSIELFLISNTTNDPESGVIFEDVTLNFRRDIAAQVSATGVSLATITTAHADWGFVEIGEGRYRVDLPDAALATGADKVYVGIVVAGAWAIPYEIQLIDALATEAKQDTVIAAISTSEALIRLAAAGATGTVSVVDNGDDTLGLTFYDTDGVAVLAQATYSPVTGERSRTS